MRLTLKLQGKVDRSIDNANIEFTHFLFALPGVDTTVWVDGEGKVCLFDVPAYKTTFVREGYESLRQTPETDPLLSRPIHSVNVTNNVGIPMRDGLKLATDIHFPEGGGEFPVILIRTPYKKELEELQARYYARRGYIVAVQDVRGRFSSPGVWEPFVNEGHDGYDAIEWLARQSWSTGKVGMVGGSYLGGVQWWAAAEQPPHLVTIVPIVTPPDPFYNAPYEYGVFFLAWAIWWLDVVENNATADISGVAMSRIWEKKIRWAASLVTGHQPGPVHSGQKKQELAQVDSASGQ